MDESQTFCCVDPFSQPNCSWKKYDKGNRPKQVTDLELTRSDLLKWQDCPFRTTNGNLLFRSGLETQIGWGRPVSCEIGCQKCKSKIWFNYKKKERKNSSRNESLE